MSASPNWFCLRAQPKHEHIAAAHLKKSGTVEVFLPRIRFQRSTQRGLVWVTEALFPNYLFAQFEWETDLRQVQSTRGVGHVVHFGSRWPIIEDAIIQDLKRAMGNDELHVIARAMKPGDAVEIGAGAMRGLQAVVSRVMASRDRVAVLLDFLGRQTTIEVPTHLVVRAGDIRVQMVPPNHPAS